MPMVRSKDGTAIAYDKTGHGPAVLLVTGATMARTAFFDLAQKLETDFTVYNYDRRGRGDSSDTMPFALNREIDDTEAVIEVAGGSAYVYGISSGACLALHIAAKLGDMVTKLALYEAPYDEADGAADKWRQYRLNLEKALSEDRRDEALTLFLSLVGLSSSAVTGLKSSPSWGNLIALAPTLSYDAAAMGEDRSVPTTLAAKVTADTLVLDGSASLTIMPFMTVSADKLAKNMPTAHRRTLDGQAHNISSDALAPVLREFFLS